MTDHLDEPLVTLVRALTDRDDDPRRIVHINRLADALAERLRGVSDDTLGDRVWVDDCVKTLTRLLAHLASQQVADRKRIDAIEHALTVTVTGQPPRLANLQAFEHDIRNSVYVLAGESFNPLMDHIIALQDQMKTTQDTHAALLVLIGNFQAQLSQTLETNATSLTLISGLQQQIKRVQQSIIALQDRVEVVADSGDSTS